jgi:hypothetical protein
LILERKYSLIADVMVIDSGFCLLFVKGEKTKKKKQKRKPVIKNKTRIVTEKMIDDGIAKYA